MRGDRALASLLELAEACGVPVAWSCRIGGLVDGEGTYIHSIHPRKDAR
jgi:hypothetical protein